MSHVWVPFCRFPILNDLSGLHCLLQHHQIVHRFTEEGKAQVLWVSESFDKTRLAALIDEFLDGAHSAESQLDIGEKNSHSIIQNFAWTEALSQVKRAPLSSIIIFISLLVFIYWDEGSVYVLLHYPESGFTSELWRYITPVFLHFGAFHLLSNSLWVWVFGTKFERVMSPANYLALFFVSALSGNMLQYMLSGEVNFGGLSGVVFGYCGAVLIFIATKREALLRLPRALIAFMLVSLILGFSGGFDWLLGIQIANWAHLGGLIGGMAWVLVWHCFQDKLK